ncbi:hypothetical protein [Deinococcus marmoris]|uniref:hypothetical protein n=1 Tax=Deinococcus marmoris TaxID=249408 RepID=UPI00096A36A7|nr:hypothetical protein [Deinococcus marmoris]
MKASDVLLCLSLEEQQQEEIFDRLAKHGHLPGMSYLRLRNMLKRLTTDGLVVTREQVNGACFYRLAEGEAVEVALDKAWAKVEAERNRKE